ncbi:MAG: alpha/beta hydrolase [Rhizobiales bacterium]|nr:alpha/beta hydrolase [Hyphomicrobiales bacterium]
MERYRGMDRAALDIAYSNRAVVADWQGYLDRWTKAGEPLYAARATARDLPYGDRPRQRLDLFLTEDPAAPTCLFLHGGYWQWNDKEGQAFVAEGLLAHGFNAAIGEYTLAPDAGMAAICGEAVAQVGFLAEELARRGRHAARIYLAGISTGAHLMAQALAHPSVRGALLISGIYDLEPIRVSSLNGPIGMDMAEARRFSPIHQIQADLPPIILAYGGIEIPEIRRQSEDYRAALSFLGHSVERIVVPGCDHFSVLEQLSAPEGVLSRALADLAGRGG